MDNLRTEGYIPQVERACLQERPRAAMEICLVEREASRANPDPRSPGSVCHGRFGSLHRNLKRWQGLLVGLQPDLSNRTRP